MKMPSKSPAFLPVQTVVRAALTTLVACTALAAVVPAAQAADKLKVGMLSTLSGAGAGLGVDIRDGFALAVQQNGGKLGGLPVETVIADDQQNPEVAKQSAERLLKRDKVDVMTGIVFSNVMLAVGQLDYAAELAQARAARPDAMYIFLPGGMGINFIKQFVGAGLSKDVTLFGPGFSADEDVIKAVGEPMLGMFNSSHWAHDLDNPANKRFVADFVKAYSRLPSLYASQGYDAALLIGAAVRDVKGEIEDKPALLKALKAAKFESVRGAFRFNHNQYPVQDYYLRVITKDPQGRVTNRTLGKIFEQHADAYAPQCKMK